LIYLCERTIMPNYSEFFWGVAVSDVEVTAQRYLNHKY